jgi:hypothetical protein
LTRNIVVGVSVHANAETLRTAITTRDGLSSFWTSDVAAEPEVGSEARFGFAGAPMPLRMRVDRIDDDGVVWTCLGDFPFWEGTGVTWSLTPEVEHGGTNVLFEHSGLADTQPLFEYGTVVHTWAMVVDRLKVLAETGSAMPVLG